MKQFARSQHAPITLMILLAAGARAGSPAPVTPPGTVLVHFDGLAATPAAVLARVKDKKTSRHEIRYRAKNDIASYEPVKPVAWALRFGTVEDPTTHGHYLRELDVVLLENSEFVCSAETNSLVVGVEKLSFPDDEVKNAMLINVLVTCKRGKDGFAFSCGGSVGGDGTAPDGCNAYGREAIRALVPPPKM